ncbi:membrane protein [Clostridia bacterium]|nr:membrane protein [Clostridia bacterium]
MNTREYIEELKIHLRKLPDDDREDAISYYFEYLTEAGPGGAEEAMARLGTPAQLAAGIRADRAWERIEDGDANLGEGVSAVWRAGVAAIPRTILAVFVTAIVIVIFFTIIIALFALSVGLMAGGIAGLVGGFIFLPVSIPPALFLLGCALVVGAVGFLLFRFSIWVSKHLLYGIAGLFNGIRRSKQAKIRHKAAKRADKTERKTYTTPGAEPRHEE